MGLSAKELRYLVLWNAVHISATLMSGLALRGTEAASSIITCHLPLLTLINSHAIKLEYSAACMPSLDHHLTRVTSHRVHVVIALAVGRYKSFRRSPPFFVQHHHHHHHHTEQQQQQQHRCSISSLALSKTLEEWTTLCSLHELSTLR